MGSPISPIVANLFMEDLEVQAIQTSSTAPALWKRFVDDTFTIIKKEDRNSFLQHVNSIHQNIKFTCEDIRDDGSMPFLDSLITHKEDGSLSTSVFRMPTLTDLYLQWDSHHTISSKYSVAGTLYHRAKTICSDPQLFQKEEGHLCQALKKCKYCTWAINRAKLKSQNPMRNRNNNNQTGCSSCQEFPIQLLGEEIWGKNCTQNICLEQTILFCLGIFQIQLLGVDIWGNTCIFEDNIGCGTQNIPLRKQPPLVLEFFKYDYLGRRYGAKSAFLKIRLMI